MVELGERVFADMQLTGLAEATKREYLPTGHQPTIYSMIAPDRLTERQVHASIRVVRDELEAKGTFAPILVGLKFFYPNSVSDEWPLQRRNCADDSDSTASGCSTRQWCGSSPT